MGTLKQVQLGKLLIDRTLYPRHTISDVNVADLRRAYESGETLPPIIVDPQYRIVDGVHRVEMYRKVLDDADKVAVEVRRYKNDGELFLDAVKLNASHGRKLDRHDQSRIVLMCRELKVPDQRIAVTLHVPERSLQSLAVRVVYDVTGIAIANKKGFKHLEGQTLSQAQIEVHSHVQSGEVSRRCRELIGILETDMYDASDEAMLALLAELGTVIARVAAKHMAA